MNFTKVDCISNITKSSMVKRVNHDTTVFKQDVFINAEGDFEVFDRDCDITLKLDIPVHTFESYVNVLTELRKDFHVACAYFKEPIFRETYLRNKDNIKGDEGYSIVYWSSAYMNVLYSSSKLKECNVFIYLEDFKCYANLLVCEARKATN